MSYIGIRLFIWGCLTIVLGGATVISATQTAYYGLAMTGRIINQRANARWRKSRENEANP